MDYRDSHRQLQDQFDTRRLADRLASVAGDDVTGFKEFIEARDMLRSRPRRVPQLRDEWFDGTLASGDPALDTAQPSAPATPRF